MTMPYYVAPEQVMKDRAEYARKGIARGRSLIACSYTNGILIAAHNPSAMLHKVSEIYDRIAFAGVGKYNEFDSMRIAGVRHADVKGYSYSRNDVEARSLATAYAQMLGQVFTHEMKPLEVEILLAEVGFDSAEDRMFHIYFDGTVVDEKGFAVLGGEAEAVASRIGASYRESMTEAEALQFCVEGLSDAERLTAQELEVALVDRTLGRRCFQRLEDSQVADLLGA